MPDIKDPQDYNVWDELEGQRAATIEAEGMSNVAFSDDELVASPAAAIAGSQMPESQHLPSTAATTECVRGPCQFLWDWTQQSNSVVGDLIRIQYNATCTQLGDLQNISHDRLFHCGKWWPLYLSFIPSSLRPFLRPIMRHAYIQYLKNVKKADFSWKWWPDNIWALTPDEIDAYRQIALKKLRRR